MKNIDIIVQSIISHQEEVLGPLAREQAKTVAGIEINSAGKVKISLKTAAQSKDLLGNLVKKYEKLFGRASIEVCKDAVKESGVTYADSDLPDILK